MISLDKFISHFSPPRENTFNNFYEHAKIRYTKTDKPISDVITKQNAKIIYDSFIKNYQIYLQRFYNASLDVHFPITDKPMPISKLENMRNRNYKNIIRNLFMTEILKTTTTSIDNLRPFMIILEELMNEWTIDYKMVTPSSLYYFKEGITASILSAYYFRASIMNPYLVYSFAEHFKPKKVFSPTLGWGSYMLGFLSSTTTHYVGVDVIPNVCRKLNIVGKRLFPDKKIELYCDTPSQHLGKEFIKKYYREFDMVFFSPPYYDIEIYGKGKKQSTNEYKTYEEWLVGYWEGTIQLCKSVLRKGGLCVYVIGSYSDRPTLVTDMNKITKQYFTYLRKYHFYNMGAKMTKKTGTTENIYVFEN
jgi:hypothetical protein